MEKIHKNGARCVYLQSDSCTMVRFIVWILSGLTNGMAGGKDAVWTRFSFSLCSTAKRPNSDRGETCCRMNLMDNTVASSLENVLFVPSKVDSHVERIIADSICAMKVFFYFINDEFFIFFCIKFFLNHKATQIFISITMTGDFFYVNRERWKQKPQQHACIGKSLIIRQLNGSRNFIKSDSKRG